MEASMSSNELGNYLRDLRTRNRLSLRKAQEISGASGSYLSQIEQGKRHPSADLLRKIAPAYGTSIRDLLTKAGYLDEPEIKMGEQDRIEWAFQAVAADPDYRFGTSLKTPDLTLEAKRFIIEVYEKATGRKLL
jgi:transcriptional regulator with XRE-family HTH domain